MRNVLKRIFEFLEFFVQFVVFEIWSIMYSTTILNWSGNLIQKYKPENQSGRWIQFKSIQGLGVEPPVGVWGGLGERSPPNIIISFLISVQNRPYLKK